MTYNVKNKNVIFTILLLFIGTFSVYSILNYIDMKNNLEDLKLKHTEQIDILHNILQNELETKLKSRINSILYKNNSELKLKAIKDKNYKAIQELFKTDFEIATSEIEGFAIMQIFDTNGISLGRLHDNLHSGDDLSEFRDCVKDIISNPRISSFFEVGKHGLAFRHITPIYEGSTIIGFLELGIKPSVIIKSVQKVFDSKLYFFVKEEFTIAHKKEKISSGGYKLCTLCTTQDDFITNAIKFLTLTQDNHNDLLIHGNTYSIIQKPIFDALNQHIGKIVIFNDITTYTKQLNLLILKSIALLVITLLITYILLNEYLTKIFKKINQKTKELQRLNDIISKSALYTTTDLKGNITYISEAFANLTGYNKEFLIGKSHRIFKHPSMSKAFFDDLWETINKNQRFIGEIQNSTKDGTSYWTKIVIDPMFDDNGNKIGYSSYRENITDKKELEYISSHDTLTGIYNRRAFVKHLQTKIKSAFRYKEPFGFIMLDIDHFKKINDTYGHQVGDKVLITLSNTIQENLREDDFFARWGGEEFVIIAKYSDMNSVEQLVKKLQTKLSQTSFAPVERLTCSFGITIYHNGDNDETIVKRADQALYISKENGRNRYEVG
ncbi:MAG: diguanylate cyclase [Campylobacterota bacterium]